MPTKFKIIRPEGPGKYDAWHLTDDWVPEGDGHAFDTHHEAQEVLDEVFEEGCEIVPVEIEDDEDEGDQEN
jgi:hypothetical protein